MTVTGLLPALPLQSAIASLREEDMTGSPMYISQRLLRVTPPVDPDRLAAGWEAIHACHDAMRSQLIKSDQQWIQAIYDTPRSPIYEHLDVAALAEAHRARVLADLTYRHGARVQGDHTATAALGAMANGTETLILLSWRHELFDGTGIATIIRDLQVACEGGAVTPGPSLASVLRQMLAQKPIELGSDLLGDPPAELATFDGAPSRVTAAVHRALDTALLTAAARLIGTTPAVLATAAWITALADTTGSAGFVVTAEDCRPLAHLDIPGMFTGVGAAWPPPGAGSVAEVARFLQAHRRSVAGRRPVALSDLLRPAWTAASTGMPDVLLTVHPPMAGPRRDHRWHQLNAVERTEFALSTDILLGHDGGVVAHRDASRVSESAVDAILDAFANRIHMIRDPVPFRHARRPATRTVRGDATRTSMVLAVCRTALADPAIQPDTDLLAAGADSLAMMRLAVALGDAGVPVSVTSLFYARTPQGIAETAAAPSTTFQPCATSPLEQSLLQRTERHRLGLSPMHEQSVIVVGERLDPQVLEASLRHVAIEVEAVRTRWAADRAWAFTEGNAVPFETCDVVDDKSIQVASHRILAADLDRGFRPGDQLFRAWLVRGPSQSAFVASWHNAILDGWSHGTLIRLLQDTYRAVMRKQQPPSRPGAPISSFRAWCGDRADSTAWWSSYLAGTEAPVPKPAGAPHERCVSNLRLLATTARLTQLSPEGASLVVTAITAISHALIEVLGAPPQCPIGVRIGLRPPELRGSLRMIGLATLEAPIRMNPLAGLRDAAAVTQALGQARDHGHIGECGIKDALSWPADSDLYEILVVPETELYEDEWAVRGGSTHAWPEISAWRREVSPSIVTAYVHVNGAAVEFRISSPHNTVDTLASEVAKAVQQILTT
jgi:hypothetical protein